LEQQVGHFPPACVGLESEIGGDGVVLRTSCTMATFDQGECVSTFRTSAAVHSV
jgi:hypothetical protein